MCAVSLQLIQNTHSIISMRIACLWLPHILLYQPPLPLAVCSCSYHIHSPALAYQPLKRSATPSSENHTTASLCYMSRNEKLSLCNNTTNHPFFTVVLSVSPKCSKPPDQQLFLRLLNFILLLVSSPNVWINLLCLTPRLEKDFLTFLSFFSMHSLQ